MAKGQGQKQRIQQAYFPLAKDTCGISRKIWTLDDIFRRWPGLWFRIIFETSLPTLAALIWGVTGYVKGKGIFDAISAAGVAFPIVLFAQGQLFRMAKNVRDERDADEFRESFASLQEGLNELRQQRHEPAPVILDRPPPIVVESEDLMAEAQASVAQGRYFAGVVLAAIEFERTLRETAAALGMNTQRPLGVLVNELAGKAEDKDLWMQLRTLVRIRNSPSTSGGDGSRSNACRRSSSAIDFLVGSSAPSSSRLLDRLL